MGFLPLFLINGHMLDTVSPKNSGNSNNITTILYLVLPSTHIGYAKYGIYSKETYNNTGITIQNVSRSIYSNKVNMLNTIHRLSIHWKSLSAVQIVIKMLIWSNRSSQHPHHFTLSKNIFVFKMIYGRYSNW